MILGLMLSFAKELSSFSIHVLSPDGAEHRELVLEMEEMDLQDDRELVWRDLVVDASDPSDATFSRLLFAELLNEFRSETRPLFFPLPAFKLEGENFGVPLGFG